jgi:hypothetical protein
MVVKRQMIILGFIATRTASEMKSPSTIVKLHAHDPSNHRPANKSLQLGQDQAPPKCHMEQQHQMALTTAQHIYSQA